MRLGDDMRGQLYPCVGLYAGKDAVGTTVEASFGKKLDLPDAHRETYSQVRLPTSEPEGKVPNNAASEKLASHEQGGHREENSQAGSAGGPETDSLNAELAPEGSPPLSEEPAQQHLEQTSEDAAQTSSYHEEKDPVNAQDLLQQHEEATQQTTGPKNEAADNLLPEAQREIEGDMATRSGDSFVQGNDFLGDYVADLQGGTEGDAVVQSETAVELEDNSPGEAAVYSVAEAQVDGALGEPHTER